MIYQCLVCHPLLWIVILFQHDLEHIFELNFVSLSDYMAIMNPKMPEQASTNNVNSSLSHIAQGNRSISCQSEGVERPFNKWGSDLSYDYYYSQSHVGGIHLIQAARLITMYRMMSSHRICS